MDVQIASPQTREAGGSAVAAALAWGAADEAPRAWTSREQRDAIASLLFPAGGPRRAEATR